MAALRPSGGTGFCGGRPRCDSTIGPQVQPPAVIIAAISPASFRAGGGASASSSSNIKAICGNSDAIASPFCGRASPI